MSTKSQIPPPPSSSGPAPLCCVIELAHESRREAIRRRRQHQEENPVKPRHRVHARELEANLKDFVACSDGNDVGALTITSAKWNSWEDERIKLKKANRFLHKIFPGGFVRFTEFTKRGVLHHHLVGRVSFNLADGYDYDGYRRLKDLNERRDLLNQEERRELRSLRKRKLGNAQLEDLADQLRGKLPKYGFGVVTEIAPIRENIQAISNYMAGGYYYTIRYGKDRPKGGRIYAYSRNFPRVKLPVSAGRVLLGTQIAFIVAALGLDNDGMLARYGKGWRYLVMTRVIDEFNAFPGPNDPKYWDSAHVAMNAAKLLAPYDRTSKSREQRQAEHEAEVLAQLTLPSGPVETIDNNSLMSL
jgi:hypothetical protein